MYPALARFGYGIVKKLRPSKIKNLIKPTAQKLGDKLPKGSRMAKIYEGTGSKMYSGYRKAYGATVGTSTRRKVTSGVLGGYTLGRIFDED